MKLIFVAMSMVLFQIQGAIFMASIYNKYCEFGQCPWDRKHIPEQQSLEPTRYSLGDELPSFRHVRVPVGHEEDSRG